MPEQADRQPELREGIGEISANGGNPAKLDKGVAFGNDHAGVLGDRQARAQVLPRQVEIPACALGTRKADVGHRQVALVAQPLTQRSWLRRSTPAPGRCLPSTDRASSPSEPSASAITQRSSACRASASDASYADRCRRRVACQPRDHAGMEERQRLVPGIAEFPGQRQVFLVRGSRTFKIALVAPDKRQGLQHVHDVLAIAKLPEDVQRLHERWDGGFGPLQIERQRSGGGKHQSACARSAAQLGTGEPSRPAAGGTP